MAGKYYTPKQRRQLKKVQRAKAAQQKRLEYLRDLEHKKIAQRAAKKAEAARKERTYGGW